MIYVIVVVPCVGSQVYVVKPAIGGTHKTLSRDSLLSARPPATDVDDYAQEDSLPYEDAILLVPEIDTAADTPDSESIVDAVPTLIKRVAWWW